jgi:hypothetical protein
MLVFDVSERTISRWMRRAPRDPEPAKRWLAFLKNHREAIAAMDFLTVPTVTLRLLYCFGHSLHYGLSAPPTASPSSVPGGPEKHKPRSNDSSVGEQPQPEAIPLNIQLVARIGLKTAEYAGLLIPGPRRFPLCSPNLTAYCILQFPKHSRVQSDQADSCRFASLMFFSNRKISGRA